MQWQKSKLLSINLVLFQHSPAQGWPGLLSPVECQRSELEAKGISRWKWGCPRKLFVRILGTQRRPPGNFEVSSSLFKKEITLAGAIFVYFLYKAGPETNQRLRSLWENPFLNGLHFIIDVGQYQYQASNVYACYVRLCTGWVTCLAPLEGYPFLNGLRFLVWAELLY